MTYNTLNSSKILEMDDDQSQVWSLELYAKSIVRLPGLKSQSSSFKTSTCAPLAPLSISLDYRALALWKEPSCSIAHNVVEYTTWSRQEAT